MQPASSQEEPDSVSGSLRRARAAQQGAAILGQLPTAPPDTDTADSTPDSHGDTAGCILETFIFVRFAFEVLLLECERAVPEETSARLGCVQGTVVRPRCLLVWALVAPLTLGLHGSGFSRQQRRRDRWRPPGRRWL